MPGMSAGAGIIRTTWTGCWNCRGSVERGQPDVNHAAECWTRGTVGCLGPRAHLEYIAVRSWRRKKCAARSVLRRPTRTGKTSLGKSSAEALGRKFVRVTWWHPRRGGDPRPSPDVHRRTAGPHYPTMRRAETVNPLFMLDEIDKVGTTSGDPSSGALGGARPRTEFAFSDTTGSAYDLSKVCS